MNFKTEIYLLKIFCYIFFCVRYPHQLLQFTLKMNNIVKWVTVSLVYCLHYSLILLLLIAVSNDNFPSVHWKMKMKCWVVRYFNEFMSGVFVWYKFKLWLFSLQKFIEMNLKKNLFWNWKRICKKISNWLRKNLKIFKISWHTWILWKNLIL